MVSTISATLQAVASNPNSSGNSLNWLWDILKYLSTPAVIIAGVYFLLQYVFKFGELKQKSTTAFQDIESLKTSSDSICNAVIEIQSTMRAKLKVDMVETIRRYGQANSPIVLKAEFKKFIHDVNLDKQINEKKNELVDWLKKQNPPTGIDAQNKIINLIEEGKINEYLDLTDYKQHLYENGKTVVDADGILAIYLFELLIPELDFKKVKTSE